MDRRSFLGIILAAAVAPAIVRAESIMRVRPIVLQDQYGRWVDTDWVGQDEVGRVEGDRLQVFTGEIGRVEGVRYVAPGLTKQMLNEMIDNMKLQHIPPGRDGNYVWFAHPSYVGKIRG